MNIERKLHRKPSIANFKIPVAIAVLGSALSIGISAPARAGDNINFTGNIGLNSQYIFRGMTQTAGKPALQGGVDVTHHSGLYAGLWGSNVNWLQDYQGYRTGSLEIDLYGGYRGQLVGEVGYDVGYIRYNYPGSRPAQITAADTNEVYAGVNWKWVSAKLNYSLGDTFGFATPAGSTYFDLGVAAPMAESGLTVGVHWGSQRLRGAASIYGYEDWKLALSYDLGKFASNWRNTTIGLQYTGTNADRALWTDRNGLDLSRSRATVWITRTF